MIRQDVVVIGAGMVGLTAALGFANQGRSVVLVDKKTIEHLPEEANSPSARVSAITPASLSTLAKAGLSEEALFEKGQFFTQMKVVDGDAIGAIEFSAREVGEPFLGKIIENHHIEQALISEVLRASNIRILDDVKEVELIAMPDTSATGWAVLVDGELIKSHLIVGADGALSSCRQQANIESVEWDYPHHAVVTNLRTDRSHQQTAFQWFTLDGPLAFLPLPYEDQRTVSIVWSCDPDYADELCQISSDELCRILGLASEETLGKVELLQAPVKFPLRQRHAKRYLDKNMVLVGDAAHCIHPLAGQGANLGFADIDALLVQLEGRDMKKAQPYLAEWQRIRMPQNLLMAGAMEGFHRLFAQVPSGVRSLRSTGLSLFNRAGPVKRALIRQAMGV